MPAIPAHNTAVVDEPWDAAAEVGKIPNDAGERTFRRMYAWVDPDKDAATKAAYKFPHHKVTDGKPGPANLNGVRNGLARLPNANIPDGDRAGVESHLRRHLNAQSDGGGSAEARAAGEREQELERAYPHVVAAVQQRPWAILPEKLVVMRDLVAFRNAGHRLSEQEIRERLGAREPRREAEQTGPVAVIPVWGVIAPRMSLMTAMSGGTSLEKLQDDFRAALDDPDVAAILLDVDSPGGTVDLVPETAALIRGSRGGKPIVAVANTDAYSAAYYLAAQADELVVTPSGGVGSIGVFAAHEDISVLQEKMGVKTTLVFAGEHKVDGNPFEPLSEDARAKIQADVDEFYAMFVADVAKGRGLDEELVRGDKFGAGRTVMARAALKAGMVDRVDTYDATLARLTKTAAAGRSVADGERRPELVVDARRVGEAFDASEPAPSPPRDGIVRALQPGPKLREANGGPPVMDGYLAVFNEWAEIDSTFEGHFLERVAPGAFAKTMREKRDRIKVLFQHGRDPVIGNKPLGRIERLGEDDIGAAYEVALLDTAYNAELLPGLREGLYGSSFRFRVQKEEFERRPKKSAWNAKGLPERTIREAELIEFGPVTFPAYQGATAGVRSLTDEYLFATFVGELASDPERLRAVVSFIRDDASASAPEPGPSPTPPAQTEPGPSPTPERAAAAVAAPANTKTQEGQTMASTIEELVEEREEHAARIREIDSCYVGEKLPAEVQEEWNRRNARVDDIDDIVVDDRRRKERVRALGEAGSVEAPTKPPTSRGHADGNGGWARSDVHVPRDIWNLAEYRRDNDLDDLPRAYREGAKRALEAATFPHPLAKPDEAREQLDRLMDGDKEGEVARRILATGSPAYQRAFAKYIANQPRTTDEERALTETGSAGADGGFAVPFVLDPSVILTSNGAVNPLRELARVVRITGSNVWKGISSAGVTASYDAEAAEVSDDTPAFAQPSIQVEKAQAFVPFSIELDQDWGTLREELAVMLQDSKDTLEANKFLVGVGHSATEPQGLLVGATAQVLTAATATFAVADLYALVGALPPRYVPRANMIGAKATFARVRQFDTSGGAALWVQLAAADPPLLLGYGAYEDSGMAGVLTSGSSIITIGDFSRFVIVDRIGLNVEIIPHLFGTNRRPTGLRGFYAYWRNSSGVVDPNAFRTLVTR